MWGGSITTILGEDHPTIRAVNPRAWIHETNYPRSAFRPSLHAYSRQRDELVALLESLPPDGWARAATFTGAGKPIDRTLLSQAQRIAVHERPHLKQIARLGAGTPQHRRLGS